MKKKFGEILLERRLITPEQLADALALQRRRGMRLGAALVARGHLSEGQLVETLGSALGVRVVDLGQVGVNAEAVQLVSHRFALEHELFPFALRRERGRKILTVAMSDPMNFRVIDELSFKTNAQIDTVLARPSDIDAAITRHYGLRRRASEAYGRDVNGEDLLGLASAEGETTEMTILRKGGGEEVVDTDMAPRRMDAAPFASVTADLLANPSVRLPPGHAPGAARGEEVSAVLLTDEVAPSARVDALSQPLPARGPTSGGPPMTYAGPLPGRSTPPRPAPVVPESFGARRSATGTAPAPFAPSAPAFAPPHAFGSAGTGSQPGLPFPPPSPPSLAFGGAGTGSHAGLPFAPPSPHLGPQPSFSPAQSLGGAGTGSHAGLPFSPQAPPQAPLTSKPLPGVPAAPPATWAAAIPPFGPPTPVPPPTAPVPPAPVAHPAGSPYFDDALGALLDAAGGAVNAEQFMRLERKFWALMRVLAKKGLLTNEDFMAELGEEDR